MSLVKLFQSIFCWVIIAFVVLGSGSAEAQNNCVTYQYVPQTVYDSVPTTQSRWVNETVYETQQVTSYKPVWQTETRERRTTVLKPVYKTSEREEKYIVRRPIIETTYEEREIRETTYETVTEMREQQFLVEKPVVETEYREERHVVRKPSIQRMMKTENVIVYKPVNVTETQYIPSLSTVDQWVANPETGRSRLRRVTPGYYVDPNSGQMVYSDRGLAWVRQPELELQTTMVPTMVPQVVNRTTYIPQTVQRQTPIEITTYEESIEVRQVPVQVQKTKQTIEVRKTPVTYQKPVIKIRTEKVPIQKTTYRDEEKVRKVPVNEITYERVEKVEPYEVSTCKWVAETREIRVPKTVPKRVDYQVTQNIPRTVLKRVAVDAWGNIITEPNLSAFQKQGQQESSSTVVRRVESSNSKDTSPKIFYGKPVFVDPTQTEPSQPQSVLIPETDQSAGKITTDLIPITPKPEITDETKQQVQPTATSEPLAKSTTTEQSATEGTQLDSQPNEQKAADEVPKLDGPSKSDDQ